MKKFLDNIDRFLEIITILDGARRIRTRTEEFYKIELEAAIAALSEIDDEFAAFPSNRKEFTILAMTVVAKEIVRAEIAQREKENPDEYKPVSTTVN